MSDWLATLAARLAAGPVARVTVASVRGSAPREAGACMLVGAGWQDGSIGGGHLEWKAAAIARDLLASSAPARLDRFALGATLGQCCGGAVELWFERFDARDRAFVAEVLAFRDANPAAVLVTRLSAREPSRRIEAVAPAETPGYLIERLKAAATPLYLYGAGHVGRALVAILATLPSKVTWIDSREEPFPSAIPAGVEARECESPAEVATEAPPDAIHVVMSHSHALDYEIVRAVLRRGEFAWLGLIGSETKALRFRQRLRAEGLAVDRLVCPIGVSGITSKLPAAIAVAVGAQVLRELEVSQGSVRTTLAQR